jgi:hypothetical protein
MELERLPSSFNSWRIHTIEYPNRPSYVTLTDTEMDELMQVVLGKKPSESGEEPDDLLQK